MRGSLTTGGLTWVQARTFTDQRGELHVLESGTDIPFEIKRAYIITKVPASISRGGHAHKKLRQVIIPVSGSVTVRVNDGKNSSTALMTSNSTGILIEAMVWRELFDFSYDAVCLCLVSEPYDETDYIRDFEEFQKRIELQRTEVGVPSTLELQC